MKKQSIVIAFYCSTLIFTLIYAEPQLSYWQQFKNWISGGASYAQSTAGASYEWAQNFVAGLTPVQKEMLKGALIGFGMTGGIASIKSGKTSAHGALTAAGGGALMMGILAEQPKANQIASGQIIQLIRESLEGLSREQKIAQLNKMRNDYLPNGKNPDEVKLNAVDIILAKLAKK